jgi:RNA polymerase sigma-70 factor, ECF subfamily
MDPGGPLSTTLFTHESLLHRVASRLVGPGEADDVVQETFLRALAAPPDPSRPIAPWLIRVARNLAIDVLRKRSKIDLVDELDGASEPEPSRVPIVDLLPALGALTETEVVVLLLREVLDLGVDEVAEVLETSPGSVRVLHHRARRKAVTGSLDDALHAVSRFVDWLLARAVMGRPVRSAPAADDPAWTMGVIQAHAKLMDAMVTVAETGGRDDLELRARLWRADAASTLGRAEPALADYTRARELADRAGFALEGAYAQLRMVLRLFDLQRRPEGLLEAERGLAALSRMEDHRHVRHMRAELQQLLVRVAVEDGRSDDAAALLAAMKATSDPNTLDRALAATAAGTAALLEERFDEAEALFLEGLAFVRSIGHVRNEGACASNVGMCAQGRGDLEQAERWFAHAHACAVRCGDPVQEAMAESNLAVLAQLAGRLDDATVAWPRLIATWSSLGRVPEEAESRMYAAILDHIGGRLERAERGLREAARRMINRADQRLAEAHLAAIDGERGTGSPEAFARLRSGASRGLQAALPLLEAVGGPADVAEARLASADERIVQVRLASQVLRAALTRA